MQYTEVSPLLDDAEFMKKYMDLKRIVKNVADVRVIEGNRVVTTNIK